MQKKRNLGKSIVNQLSTTQDEWEIELDELCERDTKINEKDNEAYIEFPGIGSNIYKGMKKFIHTAVLKERERIIEKIKERKSYVEWASERDNQMHDIVIDGILDSLEEKV